MKPTSKPHQNFRHRNDSDSGSSAPKVERTEWTPSFAIVPSPSLWKQPLGKPLTNRRINELVKEGHYGPQAQEKARADVTVRSGIIFRCSVCGETHDLRFRDWDYLPKPNWYCPACIKKFRAERDKDKELKKQWKEMVKKEYV